MVRIVKILFLVSFCVTLVADESFKVATWNCDTSNGRRLKERDIQKFIKAVDSDVLLLQEVKSASVLRQLLKYANREDDDYVISSFQPGDGDYEVAIVSRYELAEIVEYDPRPEPDDFRNVRMPRSTDPRIESIGTARGYLKAKIPELKLIVLNTHLKSSQKAIGKRDLSNAKKRELVAASAIEEITRLQKQNPGYTILFGGDLNVGVSDAKKNGSVLEEDSPDGKDGKDLYDDTHAIMGQGIIPNTVSMRNLCEGMESTYGRGSSNPFPEAGAIDVLYVTGPANFKDAVRISQTFGADHKPVYAQFSLATIEEAPLAAIQRDRKQNNADTVTLLHERLEALQAEIEEIKSSLNQLSFPN